MNPTQAELELAELRVVFLWDCVRQSRAAHLEAPAEERAKEALRLHEDARKWARALVRLALVKARAEVVR